MDPKSIKPPQGGTGVIRPGTAQTQISTVYESADGARHWDSHLSYLLLAKWAIERCDDAERAELFDVLSLHDLQSLLGTADIVTRPLTPAEIEITEAEDVMEAARFFGKVLPTELAGTIWETGNSDAAPVG